MPLGTDSAPNEALRKHQESLIELTRSLMHLQPLRDTDPAIARKYETLKPRLKTEQDRIGLLTEAIVRLNGREPPAPTED